MGLQGNLKSVSFPDLLQLLTMGGKSGTLKLTKGDESKEIFLKNGQIIYATSDRTDDSFENAIIKRENITLDQLNKAREVSRITNKGLPATLVFLNIMTKEHVAELVRRYVEDIVFSLFSWQEGNFVFYENELPDLEFMVHALNTMNILLEGTRRIDEWTRLQRNLPPDSTVLKVVASAFSDEKQFHLTPEDAQILSLVDGERNVEEIKRRSPLDLFATARALNNLIISEIVKPIGLKESTGTKEVEETELITAIVELYAPSYRIIVDKLKSKVGKSAYSRLGKIYNKGKDDYKVVEFISLEKDGLDLNNLVELVMRELPSETRIHDVSSGLAELLSGLLSYAHNTLGDNLYRDILSNLAQQSEKILAEHEQAFKQYGIYADFVRVLKNR